MTAVSCNGIQLIIVPPAIATAIMGNVRIDSPVARTMYQDATAPRINVARVRTKIMGNPVKADAESHEFARAEPLQKLSSSSR